jgi:hypothetical protein
MKKNEQNLQATIKGNNIQIIGAPEEKNERQK